MLKHARALQKKKSLFIVSSNSISELMNILPLNDRIRLRQLVEINQYLRLECTQTGELWNNPELQGIVYNFLQGEGWSPAALETVNLALDSGGGGLVNTQGLSAILQGTADFLEEKGFDDASAQAVKAIFSLIDSDQLAGPYTDAEREAIIQEHFFNPDQYVQFVTHCILLKAEWELNHPGQSCDESITCQVSVPLEAYWKTVRGIVHTALDICGVVPVAGEGCDFANGTLYILEGDGVNASISFAATIPFWGWVASGAKWAKIIVETATGPLEFVVKLDLAGKITFPLPTGKTFREIVGITDPLDDAHHLIPQAVKNHDLVQQAASAKHKTFHLHHPKNGMAAKKYRINYQPNGIHANHPNYNNQVSQKMDEIIQDLETDYGTPFQQIDPDIVAERLINFQNSLRGLIEANPTTKINDLIIP